jgi:hypothetical protein
MCWVLLVSSLSQFHPSLTELQEVIRRAQAMREYDRHGLLFVTETHRGVTIGLSPDAEERLEALAPDTRADG